MEAIFKEAVQKCFHDEKMQNYVVRLIANNYHKQSANRKTVRPLAMLALKPFMEKLMRFTYRESYIYWVIFKEPVDIREFARRVFVLDSWDDFVSSKVGRESAELKTNPHFMYEMLEQNVKKLPVSIMIHKDYLNMSVRCENVAFILHRNGQEYDVYWATRFFNLAIAKGCESVHLEIYGNYDDSGMEMMDENARIARRRQQKDERWDYLMRLVDTFNPITPPEGWEKAIRTSRRTGRRQVYMKELDRSPRHFVVNFKAVYRYDPASVSKYWGYLDDE